MPSALQTILDPVPKPQMHHVITVRLDDGTLCDRAPADLVVLPPGLTAPLEEHAPVVPHA